MDWRVYHVRRIYIELDEICPWFQKCLDPLTLIVLRTTSQMCLQRLLTKVCSNTKCLFLCPACYYDAATPGFWDV